MRGMISGEKAMKIKLGLDGWTSNYREIVKPNFTTKNIRNPHMPVENGNSAGGAKI